MRHLVIGLGSIGKRHKRLLEEAGEIVVGVDKDPMSWNPPMDWECDMVWICSPAKTHYAYIDEALLRRIPRIFVEKPITLTLEEANELATQSKTQRIFVAQNMRFHPGAIAIKENLDKVGKIYYARLWFQHSIQNQRENWKEYMQQNDITMDCIQWIDLALWLFGPIRGNTKHLWTLDHIWADQARLQISHQNEIVSFVDLDFLRQDKSCGIEVIGEKGTLAWFSHSKNPESMYATFNNSNIRELEVINIANIEPDITYKRQLDYLLEDQWQSNINDAIASVEVALG